MFKKSIPVLIGASLFALATQAQAATGGGGLPMEAPLQRLEQSLTGPVAFTISLCALVAAFGTVIFLHHQLGDFVKTALYVVIGIACLAAAPGFASAIGITGATIGKDPKTSQAVPHREDRREAAPTRF